MRLQDVLDDPPKLHGRGDVLFKLADDVLHFMESEIDERWVTLETGAGISTILFALKHTDHRSVVPDPDQAERVRTYCIAHNIRVDRLKFEIGRSELVVPRLTLPPLDLVLIDGRHGFPTPFIDWYYTSDALRIGGLLVVDDTQLWTGDVLKQFLLAEREWRLERDFFPRATIFRKLAEGTHSKSWNEQGYVLARTTTLDRMNRLRRRSLQARRFAELLRHGEFGTIVKKAFGGR